VDNNYLDLGMNRSRFVHTLPSGRLTGNRVHCYAKCGVPVVEVQFQHLQT
jgi:hypothetical protein